MKIRKSFNFSCAISGATVLLVTTLACGTLLAETITLNLDQAIERANHHDPRIAEKEKLVGVAHGLLEEATGSESWIYGVNAFAAFAPKQKGGVVEKQGSLQIAADAFDFNGVSPWYNVDFSALHPLYTYNKVESYTKAAEQNIKLSEGDVQLERANTYIDVVRAYNGYLASRDARKLLEDANNKAESALKLIEDWLEKGSGQAKQSDLFALQTGTAIIKRYISQAQGFEAVALAGLKMLTGVGKGEVLELADKRIEPVAMIDTSLDELQQLAMSNRVEMMQVEAGLEARRALVDAKKAEYYPNVYGGVVGSIAVSPGRDRDALTQDYDPFNHGGLTPIIGIKWDLWSGQKKGQVSQAEAQYNALLEKKSFAQMGIPFQVAEQYHQMHAHNEMVKKLYDGAISGRRWMIATYADFEAGLDSSANLVTAFQGYVLAYTSYFEAVNDYNLTVARLKVAIGEIK